VVGDEDEDRDGTLGMPDDRLFHPRLLQSDKVDRLTDFERGVWIVSRLVCDDFGVMRASANTLQDAARFLEHKPLKTIQRALVAVERVGLLHAFEHEGRAFICQWDWQDWQKVAYPRGTLHPKPPPELLAICSPATRELFSKHPGGWGRKKPEPSANGSTPVQKTDPEPLLERSPNVLPKPLALAVSRKPEPEPARLAGESDELTERAGRFTRETYPALYAKYRKGARYVSKPNLDFLEALELCRVWDDARLEKLAQAFLTTDHEFAVKGSRTMAQFRALASWCDSQLVEAGIA
jgi:hypothetical protein